MFFSFRELTGNRKYDSVRLQIHGLATKFIEIYSHAGSIQFPSNTPVQCSTVENRFIITSPGHDLEIDIRCNNGKIEINSIHAQALSTKYSRFLWVFWKFINRPRIVWWHMKEISVFGLINYRYNYRPLDECFPEEELTKIVDVFELLLNYSEFEFSTETPDPYIDYSPEFHNRNK